MWAALIVSEFLQLLILLIFPSLSLIKKKGSHTFLHLALCILSLTVKVLDTIGPCLRFIIDSSLNNGYVPFCFKHERAQSSVQYKICSFQSTKWSVISSRLWKMCCFGSLSSKCSLRHYRSLYFTEMPGAVRWRMVKNFLQLNNLRLKYWFLDVLNVLTSFQNPWFTAFVKAKKTNI